MGISTEPVQMNHYSRTLGNYIPSQYMLPTAFIPNYEGFQNVYPQGYQVPLTCGQQFNAMSFVPHMGQVPQPPQIQGYNFPPTPQQHLPQEQFIIDPEAVQRSKLCTPEPIISDYHGIPFVNPALSISSRSSPSEIIMDQPYNQGNSQLSQSLDVVWNGKFNQCFSQFGPDEWELSPTVDTPEGDWKTFQDSAKIRFMCTTNGCNNCWTSMKGRVQFWYVLLPQYGAPRKGYVFFQLYGQKCKRCKSDSFMNPIWYPEEVVKVVENIFSKVGQEYYGKEACYSTLHRERRAGKPRERHDSDLCQACAQNKCTEANL